MHNIIIAALRISAIFLFLKSLERAIQTLPYWEKMSEGIDTSSLAALAMVILPGCVATAFWLFAPTLSKIILSPEANKVEELDRPNINLESTAFMVVGSIILASAIPDIFYFLAGYIQGNSIGADFSAADPKIPALVFATAVKTILGLWLLLGARGLSDFLLKVRAAGRRSNN